MITEIPSLEHPLARLPWERLANLSVEPDQLLPDALRQNSFLGKQ